MLSKVRFEKVTGASKYMIDENFDAGCSISYSTKRYWVLHKIWYQTIDAGCSEVRYKMVVGVSEK